MKQYIANIVYWSLVSAFLLGTLLLMTTGIGIITCHFVFSKVPDFWECFGVGLIAWIPIAIIIRAILWAEKNKD